MEEIGRVEDAFNGMEQPLLDGDTRNDSRRGLLHLVGIAAFGGAIYGWNVAAGAYLPQLSKEMNLSSMEEQAVSSAATVSDAIAMVVVATQLLERLGKKYTVILGAVLSICGCAIPLLGSSFICVIIARLVQGFGNGMSILSVPLVVAENCPVKQRGAVVSFFQIGIVAGFSLPLLIQLLFESWRLTFLSGATPATLLLCLLSCTLEGNDKLQPEATRRENTTAIESNEITLSFRQGAVLAVVLACMNNSTDAIIFYGPTIISSAGIGDSSSLLTAFLVALINVPTVAAMLVLVPRFSRRQNYLTGASLVVLSYVVIGLLYVLLLTGFQLGPGTLFIVILPELFHKEDRAKGMAIGTVSMSLLSLLCNGTMLSTIDAIGVGRTFLAYAILYALCFLFVCTYLPESQNVKLS